MNVTERQVSWNSCLATVENYRIARTVAIAVVKERKDKVNMGWLGVTMGSVSLTFSLDCFLMLFGQTLLAVSKQKDKQETGGVAEKNR